MALNKKKAAKKNKADAIIAEMEQKNSVNETIDELNKAVDDDKKIDGGYKIEKVTENKTEENQIVAEAETNSTSPTVESHSSNEKTQSHEKKKKHAGGRPTYRSQGRTCRRQYTLTMQPEMYKDILARAASEELSFAKYVERALKEYIENHG